MSTDLTSTQHLALSAIESGGHMSAKSLAGHLWAGPVNRAAESSAAQVLERLEGRGLVEHREGWSQGTWFVSDAGRIALAGG